MHQSSPPLMMWSDYRPVQLSRLCAFKWHSISYIINRNIFSAISVTAKHLIEVSPNALHLIVIIINRRIHITIFISKQSPYVRRSEIPSTDLLTKAELAFMRLISAQKLRPSFCNIASATRSQTICCSIADRTNGRAIGTVLRLSVCLSVTLCIVAKRCVLEQKLLLRAYRKSYMRNRLAPKWMTLVFV